MTLGEMALLLLFFSPWYGRQGQMVPIISQRLVLNLLSPILEDLYQH